MERRFIEVLPWQKRPNLWDRWERGELLKAIGRLLGWHHRRSIFWSPRMEGFVLRSASLQVGIDVGGTRGDFQRRHGTSIGPVYRLSAWPLALDGRVRDDERHGGCIVYRARVADERCLGTIASSKMLEIGDQFAASARRGSEAQIGLVTRADCRLAEENAS